MNTMTFEIIKAILMAVIAGVTLYLIPLIKERIGTERLNQMETWAMNAVLWAEQFIKADGNDKKKAVVDFLKKIRNEKNINITDEQIEILIEAAVKSMNDSMVQTDEREE